MVTKARQIVQVRRMRTDADRVRFAVRFASEPLSTLGLKRVRHELAAFLGLTREGAAPPGGFGVQVSTVRPPYPWQYSRGRLVQLQRDAYHLLADAVEGRGLHATTISDSQELSAGVIGPARTRRLRIGGSVRAAFLLTLAFLIAGKGAVPVLKCPECGRLFVRVRRQKYCSSTCTDRAVWRNYPEHKKRAARLKWYEKFGWELGARSKRKERQGRR